MMRALLSALLLLSIRLSAQQYPQGYFRSPLDTAISLAGNFGEIRPNHFHAGLDLRTNNREGLPVFAAAEGYIYRIKISPYGYGKALYIRHPNGYSTVYGHLLSFNPAIAAFTSAAQYSKQSFELDTLLQPGDLPVKRSELIALSGNTGGSQGPHLHFEIRENQNEMPVNPLLFGFNVPDTVAPRILAISCYPLAPGAQVNGRHKMKRIVPQYKKGKYNFLKTDTLCVSGETGFGIECFDVENGSVNRNGVYSVELQSGGRRIFYYEMEKFSFENSRYVNAHIDYPEKQQHNLSIQKCYLAKNNKTGIYRDVLNNGRLNFNDDSIHWIRFIVKDFNGNSTELMLKVRGKRRASVPAPLPSPTLLDCSIPNELSKPDFKLIIPAESLYDDVKLKYTKTPGDRYLSEVHRVLDKNTGLQKAVTISIKPSNLKVNLQDKACIVSIDDKGRISYEGGSWKDGWVTVQTKNFGNFTVVTDTVPPVIKPAMKLPKDTAMLDLSKAEQIGVHVSDNLSGIRRYRATIDGQWVLLEYETKKDLLFHTFDGRLAPGGHIFFVEVSDDKGNTSSWFCTFIR